MYFQQQYSFSNSQLFFNAKESEGGFLPKQIPNLVCSFPKPTALFVFPGTWSSIFSLETQD